MPAWTPKQCERLGVSRDSRYSLCGGGRASLPLLDRGEPQTRAFIVLCFGAGAFAARIGQICGIAEKLATVSFAAGDDFGFMKFLRIEIWL